MRMKEYSKWILRGVLGAAGVFLLSFGLMQGGFDDVMRKATLLCLECMGIG